MDKIRKIIATPSVDDDITNPLYTTEIAVTVSTEDDYDKWKTSAKKHFLFNVILKIT